MGFDRAVFRRQRRDAGARRASSREWCDFDALRDAGLGQAAAARRAVRRRRLSDAERQVHGRRARPRRARPCAELRERGVARRSWRARYPLAMISPPARNFLNSSFVNVQEPARHRGRAAARDPRRPTPPRAASPAAQMVRVFNDRGELRLQVRRQRARAAGRRQRPGRLVAQARRGRHQRQRADAPAAHRHRPRADVLRLPGRGRGARVTRVA